MIKIEKLTPGTIVNIIRDGAKRQVFLNQLITRDELSTMEVLNGTVTYSIDEELIQEKSSEPKVITVTIDTKVDSPVQVTDEVEVKTETKTPVIVQPNSRTITKTK